MSTNRSDGRPASALATNPAFEAWVPFYEEFADRLLDYRDDHGALIALVHWVYDGLGMELPTMEFVDGEMEDVDPFTVFGLFNRHGLGWDSRLALMGAFRDELGMASKPAETYGVPLLMPLSGCFYGFKEGIGRAHRDEMENIWVLLEDALAYDEHPGARERQWLIRSYDRAHAAKYSDRKFSMALFWSRPHTFISMDSTNCAHIARRLALPGDMARAIGSTKGAPDGELYLDWCDAIRAELETGRYPYRDFPQLSYAAWWEKRLEAKAAGHGREAPWAAPSFAPAASVGDLKPGDTVWHRKFGLGTVTKIAGDRITVLFGERNRVFDFPRAFDDGYLRLGE